MSGVSRCDRLPTKFGCDRGEVEFGSGNTTHDGFEPIIRFSLNNLAYFPRLRAGRAENYEKAGSNLLYLSVS